MTPIHEALAMIAEHHGPSAPERVQLLDGLGRFLSRPLMTRFDVPGFDNSAMDGYAVRAADLPEAPTTLPVEGESRAGGGLPDGLGAGRAMRIFTGAALPEGADSVVIQEDVRREGDRATITEAPKLGQHVRRRAEVLARGDVLLDVGLGLGPGELALAASQGYALLPVHRRPRLAILSTGDELREIGAPRPVGSLIDSNTYGIAAAARAAGADVTLLPLGADVTTNLEERFAQAAHADVVVSTGGASVGDHDRVAEALRGIGAEAVFYKVRMKPGKPVRFAALDGTPIFGLPGNPVSALVTFEIFVRPLLRSRLGDPRPYRRVLEVELSQGMRAPDTRDELARAKRDGRLAHPAKHQGSAHTTSLRDADLLVRLRMGAGEIPAGAKLEALWVSDPDGSAEPPFPQ